MSGKPDDGRYGGPYWEGFRDGIRAAALVLDHNRANAMDIARDRSDPPTVDAAGRAERVLALLAADLRRIADRFGGGE